MDSLESHKQLVRRYVTAFNRGDYDTLREIFAPDAVVQGVLGKGGMDHVIRLWRELHNALRVELTIEEMTAEEDRVAVRYTERGKFVGTFLGKAATSKSYELVAMEWFVIRDGKIIRRWGARDALSQARQIGLPLA